MVISLDSPESYAYPKHREILGELAQFVAKAVIVSVSSSLGSLPYSLNPVQMRRYSIDGEADDPVVVWYVRNEASQLETWKSNSHSIRFGYCIKQVIARGDRMIL